MKIIKSFVIGAIAFAAFNSQALAEVEIDGYCPVCYIAAGKAVKGVSEYKSEYEGKTYLFVKQGAKDAFDKSPEKFLPAYGGYCAYGLSLGKKIEADPQYFSVVDGKIYLNSSADTKKQFDADPSKFIGTADKKWAMESKEMKK